MRSKKFTLAALVLSSSLMLAACGGGDNDNPPLPTTVATSATTATINPSSGAAAVESVLNQNFSFASGVPAFGTTSATTLTLAGTGANPTFTIGSGGNTASGTMTYGSCIFRITSSTYPANHALALGKTTTVSPCALTIATSGITANGTSVSANITLTLGTVFSVPLTITVSVSATGVVTVNGVVIATVPVGASTGANGFGS
ncbi:MAG: hypothetical protein JWR68_1657 [Polaromonas sp.]|nr:hypothetical protein [Polaromonas sp.]